MDFESLRQGIEALLGNYHELDVIHNDKVQGLIIRQAVGPNPENKVDFCNIWYRPVPRGDEMVVFMQTSEPKYKQLEEQIKGVVKARSGKKVIAIHPYVPFPGQVPDAITSKD